MTKINGSTKSYAASKLIAALALFYIAMNFSGAADAANLILDGGFEHPAPPPGGYLEYQLGQKIGAWTVVGDSGNVLVSSTTQVGYNGITLTAQKGLASADLTGRCDCGAKSGVAQTITTIANSKYRLVFWVGNAYTPGHGTKSTVDVYVNTTLLVAATNAQGQGSTKQVWRKFTKTFTATSSATTLSFINGDPKGDVQCDLDSVSLAAIGGAN